MNQKKSELFCALGPDNAEHEIRKAYHGVIETSAFYLWTSRLISGVNPTAMRDAYTRSYQLYSQGNRLAAERWARTAKHLAQAFRHEAKIAFLEQDPKILPYLEGAHDQEYGLFERSDTTSDLLNSVAARISIQPDPAQTEMKHYLDRAHELLKKLENPEEKHELLRAERIQAAHEYGRTLECMILAHEAEQKSHPQAA
jgi:hypothetical protein